MSKLTIQKLYINKINTKFGEKEKYDLYFAEKPGIKVDCWKSQWNNAWKIGDVIEAEKNQWQSREYNGKTYWTLKAPESAKGRFTSSDEQINLLAERVSEVERQLAKLGMGGAKTESVKKEPPVEAYDENEINVKDIPF